MFKKFLKLIKKGNDDKKDSLLEEEIIQDEVITINEEELNNQSLDEDTQMNEEEYIQEKEENEYEDDNEEEIEDFEYLNIIKIERGLTIKAIDVYTKEEFYFETHEKCSKKLKVPLAYIKENLIHEHTDYFGESINYLYKELLNKDIKEDDINYLYNTKTPYELYSLLNDRIFSSKVSERKRDEILLSDKINHKKMYYTFECIDKEYDDYFAKYKSIIKRGGKKKIELLNTKKEVIEVFRSLDDCANYLDKNKDDVSKMLKYGQTKVGRYEIRYSLRNI